MTLSACVVHPPGTGPATRPQTGGMGTARTLPDRPHPARRSHRRLQTTPKPWRWRLLQLLFALVALGVAAETATAGAATLHERSLERFRTAELAASPADYSFVVLGDSHENDAVLRKALEVSRSRNPLFILHGGDYSDNGNRRATDRFLEMVDTVIPEVPLFVVVGNHERKNVFTARIGPLNFTIDSPRLGLRLIAVNNTGYALGPGELDFLSRGLAERRYSTFVAMHIPPRTRRWSWHTFSEGAAQLERLFALHRVSAAFFSHIHLHSRDEFGGVPAIITGGAGGRLLPFGFPGDAVHHVVWVRVQNGVVTTEMLPLDR